MINIKNITKKYSNNKGNFNINISINDGKCFGIIGPNGAGKTTLIRQIMGYIKPDEGEILINEINSWGNQRVSMENIGYVSGEISLYENLTGKKYLEFIFKFRKNIDKEFYENLIKHFDIDINIKIKKMSKGMKQKIALIAACMHKPKLLILDEPTSGLDPVMKNQFNKLVLRLKKEGSTILICSHIFEEISQLCDDVVFIKDGKLIKQFNLEKNSINDVQREFKKEYKLEKEYI